MAETKVARLRRSVGYLAPAMLAGFACMVALPVLIFSAVTCLFSVGFVLVPPQLRLLGRLTDAERVRYGRWLGVESRLHGPRGPRLKDLMAEPGTWRDLRWVPVTMITGSVLGFVGLALLLLPLGSLVGLLLWWVFPVDQPVSIVGVEMRSWGTAIGVGLPSTVAFALLALYGMPGLATVLARLSQWLLKPSERDRLAARVETLQVTRAGAVNAHGAELRRIERDLHDGTQARLVGIAMRLGLAEQQLQKDPHAVAALLAEAREGAEGAMTELRDVLRSMYPPILADRGLDGALSAVAARCSVPTELDVGELGVVPAPVEAATYFVVAESLTNVVKHSGAETARVTVRREGPLLVAEISDDGRGGVDEALGTGVAGMRRRLEALDGRVTVTSPAGGPTRISVECPCGS